MYTYYWILTITAMEEDRRLLKGFLSLRDFVFLVYELQGLSLDPLCLSSIKLFFMCIAAYLESFDLALVRRVALSVKNNNLLIIYLFIL